MGSINACTNKCFVYKATGIPAGGRYLNGQRRCTTCGVFIYWEGLWCPCCGYRLRLKPRNYTRNEKFYDKKGLRGKRIV